MLEKEFQQETASERKLLTDKLVGPSTTLEDRILATRELFPENRKREILASADKDSKGRPVRYFRWMCYEELGVILNSSKFSQITNPEAEKEFLKKAKEIQYYLESFLKDEGIYERFAVDFNQLCSDFTLDNYRNFIQKRLPRYALLKVHRHPAGAYSPDITGLKSLSVGAPFMLPVDPFDGSAGSPVVEFSVPTEQVLVSSSSNESEKEVNTLELKPEWVVDVYNGTQDLAERFIKDPTGALYLEYQKEKENDSLIMSHDYIGEMSMWEILSRWKSSELTVDLIPLQKQADLSGTNPDLQKPLVS